jgi:hypothetical protein
MQAHLSNNLQLEFTQFYRGLILRNNLLFIIWRNMITTWILVPSIFLHTSHIHILLISHTHTPSSLTYQTFNTLKTISIQSIDIGLDLNKTTQELYLAYNNLILILKDRIKSKNNS